MIVVGGGHNGLVCALRLAGSGGRVVVVERGGSPGGLCRAHDFHPGYRVPGILHDEGLLRPGVVRGLDLFRHGLRLRDDSGPVLGLGAEGSKPLLLHRDPDRAAGAIEAHVPADAAAYRRWRAFLDRVRGLLAAVLDDPPPPLSPSGWGDLWRIGRRAIGLHRLGTADQRELMRAAPMAVADQLGERFENPLLIELLAAPAVIGTWLGPWSAGSGANLLRLEALAGPEVVGGPAGLIDALVAAAEAAPNVELRTGAEVERIRVEGGRVVGVALAGGEAIDASVVVATCDPRRALHELVRPIDLPRRLEEAIGAYRMRGSVARLHLALSGSPGWSASGGEEPERVRIGGGQVDDLERAFDPLKYRSLPERPHLEIRVPTVHDPSLAPAGHHVLSIAVSFVPHSLDGGWTEARRQGLVDSVLGILDRHAPGLSGSIVGCELLTPVDLERDWAVTGGHLHHGEHALDQLLSLRPAAGVGNYRTPIAGLFLGGAGSHPGGGMTGGPGWLAAGTVLGDR